MKNLLAFYLLLTAFPLVHPAWSGEDKNTLTKEAKEPARLLPGVGKRGISIEFDADEIFYVSPNDTVDVMAVVDEGRIAKKIGKFVETLVTNLRVMDIKPSELSKEKSVVQFETDQYQAQYLELQHVGADIRLSLHKKGDQYRQMLPLASWKTILKELSSALPDTDQEALDKNTDVLPEINGARRSAIVSAVQKRMQGAPYVASNFLIAGDKTRFILAGDRVDILATLDMKGPEQKRSQKNSIILLQNIRVLDIRKAAFHPGQNILLLELTGTQAQYAALAWNTADVQILSRNETDKDVYYPVSPISFDVTFR
jgi:Flp pilus assembly protein CpaB